MSPEQSELAARIKALAAERNAIILAHNYQSPEIQDIADLCGDSLELSRKAAQTDAEVIVFCGVHFMAETASILSPQKTVLLPRQDAGCPMADMITADALKAKMESLPPMPVVTYVNSTAEVKALSTVCCTSANVVKVVNSLEADEMLLTPDRNLAMYAASQTGKKIHLWDGYCPTHEWLTPEDVNKARAEHPEAVFLAHPECRPEILRMADVITSTSGMLRHVAEGPREDVSHRNRTGIASSAAEGQSGQTLLPGLNQVDLPGHEEDQTRRCAPKSCAHGG